MIIVFAAGLFLFVAVAILVARTRKRLRNEKAASPIEGLPVAPNSHWIFGHLEYLDGLWNQHNLVTRYVDNSGRCTFWFMNVPALSVLCGRDIRAVFNASSFREQMPLFGHHAKKLHGSKALTLLNGREWKLHRMVVGRGFAPAAILESQNSINKVATTLINSLMRELKSSETGIVTMDVLTLLKMATFDTFGLTSFGVDFRCCGSLKPSPIASAFDFLLDEQCRRSYRPLDPFAYFYNLPSPANRRHKRDKLLIRTVLSKIISSRRVERQGRDCSDLLSHILGNESDQTPVAEFSDEDICDMLMLLLLAGYDTTSIALTYALYNVSKHPDVEKNCVEEARSALGLSSSSTTPIPDSFDPDKLPYTKAVLMESLRLYPPVPITLRNLEKSMELDGNHIPKGTLVWISIWSIQRDKRNFPRPLEFRPDRWAQRSSSQGGTHHAGNVWTERSPNNEAEDDRPEVGGDNGDNDDIPPGNYDAFCPFAAGARTCLGRKFATREAVTLLAVLLRDLKFERVPEDYVPQPVQSGPVQKPKDGMPMSIRKRI